MPVERSLFRRIASSFPTGVTVITTRDTDGTPRGLTTQTFVSVSTEPPLVSVSIDKNSRTLPALQRSGVFVVNFLRADSEQVSTKFASRDEDKFTGLLWRRSAALDGAPTLADYSIAIAECRVVNAIDAGDHWIFIGSVEHGEALEGTPLMYFRRTYAAWPEESKAPALTNDARAV